MFERMMEIQDEMASLFIPIAEFTRKEKPNSEVQDWTLRYLDCAIEEIVEMKREYPRRKFWKKGNDAKQQDEEKALEEFTDVLHFLCAAARINGWTAEEVFKAYEAKYEKNKLRFEKTL